MTARLLVETGGIELLAGLLSKLGIYPAAALVTLFGGIGAYVTGSGVSANALFMPGAADARWVGNYGAIAMVMAATGRFRRKAVILPAVNGSAFSTPIRS